MRYPHVALINHYLMEALQGRVKRLMISVPPQHGKALAHDTPVLTISGWKNHGELEVGDVIFAPSGKPISVLGVTSEFEDEAYEVVFDDGSIIVAGKSHEWAVEMDLEDTHGDRIRKDEIIETHQLTECLRDKNRRANRIRVCRPLEFAPRSLVINPYILGIWLGDGTWSNGTITVGEQDIEHFYKYGVKTQVAKPNGKHKVYRVLIPNLQFNLKRLDLFKNKHIPLNYLIASAEQRWALLQGLMDTDGTVDNRVGRASFCSKLEPLARQVYQLVASLGMKPIISSMIKTCTNSKTRASNLYWSVGFSPHAHEQVFRLKRKQDRIGVVAKRLKSTARYIRELRAVGKRMLKCIQVEGGNYLVGYGLIATHNSSLASLYFSAFFLGTYPDKRVILTSYESDFAASWGRRVRDLLEEHGKDIFGITIREDSSAANRWDVTGREGGMVAVGMGGSVTGRRADVMVIDDPHRNLQDAMSEVLRARNYEWYLSTALTRVSENGIVVLIQTRWHEEDLAGKLMKDAETRGEKWTIVRLPAIAEQHEAWPTGWTRAPGDVLCPELFSKSTVDARRRALGPHLWAGLYQQRPVPIEGGIVKSHWLKEYRREDEWICCMRGEEEWFRYRPQEAFRFATVDLAITEKELSKDDPDFFVLCAWAAFAHPKGVILALMDVFRDRIEGPDHDPIIERYHRLYKFNVIAVEKVGVSDLAQRLKRKGFPVREISQDKDAIYRLDKNKVARMIAATPMMADGRFFIPDDAEWLVSYINELTRFPASVHDDQCDATSSAVSIAETIAQKGEFYENWARADSVSDRGMEARHEQRPKSKWEEMRPDGGNWKWT